MARDAAGAAAHWFPFYVHMFLADIIASLHSILKRLHTRSDGFNLFVCIVSVRLCILCPVLWFKINLK